MNIKDQLELHGVEVSHAFGGGVYAKETKIPAGVELTQHRHKFDHLSILASGVVDVECGGAVTRHIGPMCLMVPAGVAHKVTAITATVWYCIHASDCADAEAIDSELIA